MVIFLVGLALVVLGGWGLLRGGSRGTVVLGFGTSIVVGALLIVFAALLPWLADAPVRIGPLSLTLRIRERTRIKGRTRIRGRKRIEAGTRMREHKRIRGRAHRGRRPRGR